MIWAISCIVAVVIVVVVSVISSLRTYLNDAEMRVARLLEREERLRKEIDVVARENSILASSRVALARGLRAIAEGPDGLYTAKLALKVTLDEDC